VFRPLRDSPPVDLAVAWIRDAETPLLRSFLQLFDSQPTAATKESRREN
jgi:hypothetical protein